MKCVVCCGVVCVCVCNLTSGRLYLVHNVPIKAPGSASSLPRCCLVCVCLCGVMCEDVIMPLVCQQSAVSSTSSKSSMIVIVL